RHRTFWRIAFGQLHRQRVNLTSFRDSINISDVGVIERGQNLSFALESRHTARVIREGWRQKFQRHVAFQHEVTSAIHLAHSAGPNGREYLVRAEACCRSHGHRSSINSIPKQKSVVNSSALMI